MSILKRIIILTTLLFSTTVLADDFVINKIKVTGLQRIKLGTMLSYLPVREGDQIDSSETSDIIRAIYKTGFFSDVSLNRKGNDLHIKVVERSVIGSITISGNEKIAKKDLISALREVGLYDGNALDPNVLNVVKQSILNQYQNMGLYYAKVDASIKSESRNRVAVSIIIQEGPASKIKSIKIVGNKSFSEKKLLKEFALRPTNILSFFNHSDQYSKEKFDADLEKLRTFYMDRGYLKINIDSTKVSITPDKKGIYIVVNITEGPIYKFSGFQVKGNLIGKRPEILNLIAFNEGEFFSRKLVIKSQQAISEFLGEFGYGMPNIMVDPKLDEKNKKVFVKFNIDPGHRVYIRKISFIGNHKTKEEVLRREMRMQEGSLFSMSKVLESTRRLANLGYLQDINHKVDPVPDANNQVDLLYSVKESGGVVFNMQAGYSDNDGFLYGSSLSDKNFLGTGKSVSLGFDNSKALQSYHFSYYDPYFTVNNVGFGVSAYYKKSDPARVDLSSYTTDVFGISSNFDMPMSEFTRLNLGAGVERINLDETGSSGKSVKDFIADYGKVFNQFKLFGGWSFSNIDRAIFPTKGVSTGINLDLYGPLNSKALEFYKVSGRATWYQPLLKGLILRTSSEVGYGDGFGKYKDLPFFKNFFAGGIGSVRGFEGGTLSESRDTKGKALGGNVLTTGSIGLIIPTPESLNNIVRPTLFVDVGNVFTNKFKIDDLKSSYGVQVEWRTPLAPLVFSFAKPIKSDSEDELTSFQFSLSTSI